MPPTLPRDPADTMHAQLAHWFVRRHKLSDWSAKDEQAFAAWLAADPLHATAYRQWQTDWDLLDDMPADAIARLRVQVASDRLAEANTAAGSASLYPRFDQALGQAQPEAATEPSPRRRFVRQSLTLAGIAGLATATGLGWPLWQAQAIYQQQLQTQRGQQQSVELPDGSLLDLDTSTSVAVRYYRNRREIALQEGQAVFHVVSAPDRPFHVTTFDARVTVTGTRFSVRSTPGQAGHENTEVQVQEGSVRVVPGLRNAQGQWQASSETTVFALTAGQALAIGPTAPEPRVQQPSSTAFASWRSKRLSFSDTPLAQAITEMERYADTGVVGIAPRAAQLRLSGTFNPHDAATTRRLLEGALPIRWQAQGQGFTIEMR